MSTVSPTSKTSTLERALDDIRARLVQLSKEHAVPIIELLQRLGGSGAGTVSAAPVAAAPLHLSSTSPDDSSHQPMGSSHRHSSGSSLLSHGHLDDAGGVSVVITDDIVAPPGGVASATALTRRLTAGSRPMRYRSRASSTGLEDRSTTGLGHMSSSSTGGGSGGVAVTAALLQQYDGDALDSSFSHSTNRSIIVIDRTSGATQRVPEVEASTDEIEEEVRRPTLSTQDIRNYNRQAANSSYDVVPGVAFGVEIETLIAKRSDEFLTENSVKAIRDVAPQLMSTLGSDYVFKFFEYNDAKADREYNVWKITTDLSIKPEDGRPIFGLEFVTPKLMGSSGLKRVENVCDALQKVGCATNSTTALHVHISCESLSNERLRRFSAYAIFYEMIIDQFMTLPRRADYSKYCRSNLKSVSMARIPIDAAKMIEAIDVRQSIDKLVSTMCPRLSNVKNSSRNHKINYMLLKGTQQGTSGRRLEFRQHQGTCDKQEVAAWTSFLTKYVTRASAMTVPPWEFEKNDLPSFDKLWQLIGDEDLRLYFTVKKETLPTKFDFTYDSREMFSYESDSDDGDDPTSHQPSPRSAVTAPQGGAVTPPPRLRPAEAPLPPHAPASNMPAVLNPRQGVLAAGGGGGPTPQNGVGAIASVGLSSPPASSASTAPGVNSINNNNATRGSGSTGSDPRGNSSGAALDASTTSNSTLTTTVQSSTLLNSINRNASLDQSMLMFGFGGHVMMSQLFSAARESSGRGSKPTASLWDTDLGSVSNFKAPLPVSIAVEFYGDDFVVDEAHSVVLQAGTAMMANVSVSTDPGAKKSSAEWSITAPAVEHSKFVRSTHGIRVASPCTTDMKAFAFVSECLVACARGAQLDADGAVFYSVDVSKVPAAKRRRLLECCLVYEAALTTLLDSGSSRIVGLMETVFENLDRPKRNYNEALKWIRSECGGVSNPAKDLPPELCELINPLEVRQDDDRPFRFALADKSRTLVCRGALAPAQHMLMRTFFMSYFAAKCVAMTDEEIVQAAQAAAMFGPVKLDTLKEKLDNAPECVKNIV